MDRSNRKVGGGGSNRGNGTAAAGPGPRRGRNNAARGAASANRNRRAATGASHSASHGTGPAGGSGGANVAVGGDMSRRRQAQLVNWVESVIRRHGGRIQGANLGSALAGDNVSLYRSVKGERVAMWCCGWHLSGHEGAHPVRGFRVRVPVCAFPCARVCRFLRRAAPHVPPVSKTLCAGERPALQPRLRPSRAARGRHIQRRAGRKGRSAGARRACEHGAGSTGRTFCGVWCRQCAA